MKKVKDMPRWTWPYAYVISLSICYLLFFVYWICLFFDHLKDVVDYTNYDFKDELGDAIPNIKKAYKEMREETK